MIKSIGVDAVDISRLKYWNIYGYNRLKKVFTIDELEYCLKIEEKSAERLAVRFAVKEASFKAFNFIIKSYKIAFLSWCKAVSLNKIDNLPSVNIDWNMLGVGIQDYKIFVTVSHSNNLAIAMLIVES